MSEVPLQGERSAFSVVPADALLVLIGRELFVANAGTYLDEVSVSWIVRRLAVDRASVGRMVRQLAGKGIGRQHTASVGSGWLVDWQWIGRRLAADRVSVGSG